MVFAKCGMGQLIGLGLGAAVVRGDATADCPTRDAGSKRSAVFATANACWYATVISPSRAAKRVPERSSEAGGF